MKKLISSLYILFFTISIANAQREMRPLTGNGKYQNVQL